MWREKRGSKSCTAAQREGEEGKREGNTCNKDPLCWYLWPWVATKFWLANPEHYSFHVNAIMQKSACFFANLWLVVCWQLTFVDKYPTMWVFVAGAAFFSITSQQTNNVLMQSCILFIFSGDQEARSRKNSKGHVLEKQNSTDSAGICIIELECKVFLIIEWESKAVLMWAQL